MGSFLCCLRVDDPEEDRHPTASVDGGCLGLIRWSSLPLLNVYVGLFNRGQARIAPSPEQGTNSSSSTSQQQDRSYMETFRCPLRPLAYDDPRCSQVRRRSDGKVAAKASSHCHAASEPTRHGNDACVESTAAMEKLNEILLKSSLADGLSEEADAYSSSEDEDDCPICLEEYVSENPKMILQCTHHYHLSCIYEWMERSEACPVCGKVMLFNEAT
ncbi:E3 ubiquitin-protein ligase [Ananas comosus]|uniref:RING-type E3 ubiquitin transferase n=1 Tax=Ananas comosus TaxID=4615 RepID=A0A199VUF2_ANACO|nr:E3 ubiquitin-protein ligase [Ananas comosus]